MVSIAADIQQILDLGPEYSRDYRKPQMRKRAETGTDLARQIADALGEIADSAGLAGLNLQVHAGGQEGYVSPFPWVRIYSDVYAPSAQNGIYLVYLFAADGSRVYLSLHQGTSVTKPGGGMRTTTNTQSLLFRAAQARSALGDHIEADGTARAVMTIDLAWQHLLSKDSRYKGRAYEAANILALEYHAGQIPTDEQLLNDLVNMLPLLIELYGFTSSTKRSSEISDLGKQAAAAIGSNHERDPEIRKKIELWAEDSAFVYFTELGWNVKRVGSEKRGYDLECINANGCELHVEVKGTRTSGQRVHLTGGEVKHNRNTKCGADHALYVLSDINLSSGGQCSGGKRKLLPDWSVADEDLIITQYDYLVPEI